MMKDFMRSAIEKPIPTAESVSVEYQRLRTRQNELIDADKALDAEVAEIKGEIGTYTRGRAKTDAIAALVEGVQFTPPRELSERLGEIATQKLLIKAAQDEIAKKIQSEHAVASRLVVAEFQPEQMALAQEFYKHFAAACRAHSALGKLRERLERAGLDSSSLHDFGRDICGSANRRDSDAAYAMREGIKRGYIAQSDIPLGYC